MNFFQNNIRIKGISFFVILILALFLFILNLYLVKQFRGELNKQVKTVVNIYHDKLLNDQVDSRYLLETLIPLIDDLDIPMIISTKKSDGSFNYEHINLDYSISKEDEKYSLALNKIIRIMDNNNNPLTVLEVENEPIIQIHYGDSIIINNLKWISYIEFGFILFIIILFFFGVYLVISNEKNFIYVGMAKEAAHQLGTPISSLMGWINLLESDDVNRKQIYANMNDDIIKLKNISHKFNKIGSKVTLNKINLGLLLDDIIIYYRSILPKTGNVKINLINNSSEKYFTLGDKILLYWAFENIIKNSIDSINKQNGIINLFLYLNKEFIIIDIEDNGKGVIRTNKNKIFDPGFTTKSRGWGLGLNLSKRIIEKQHSGQLSLHKSNQDKTVFKIKLRVSIT